MAFRTLQNLVYLLATVLAAPMLFTVSPIWAQATDATPIKVYFIRQLHPRSFNDIGPIKTQIDESKNSVLRSQHQVLLELTRLDIPTVFREGQVSDRIAASTNTLTNGLKKYNLQTIFPSGKIPETFDDLNEEAKSLIFEFTGVETAEALGLLAKIKAVDSLEQVQEDNAWLATRLTGSNSQLIASQYQNRKGEFYERMAVKREERLAKRIYDYVRSADYEGEPIAFVFGEDHDFSQAFKKYPNLQLIELGYCSKRLVKSQ